MEQHVAILVGTLLVIATATVLGPKLRIAAPLILVAAGIGLSLIPSAPRTAIDGELILQGVLPPLLYSSASTIPGMNFRREFGAISGLSITLVVLTSLALGLLFAWFIPDLGFVWGVALGAIISPTDAVATSIIKGGGAPGRVVVILEGEALLNDASALVVLRTAIITVAAGFTFWSAVGAFAYSVLVATVIGSLVGWISIKLRSRVHESAVNTILSFTAPFAAALPAELLHASGLVAAVVAGLVTGALAPRRLPPAHRLSDSQTWASIGLMLEGFIFLTMGLQLSAILAGVEAESEGLGMAIRCAAATLVVTVLIRGAYVALLFWGLHRRRLRNLAWHPKVADYHRSFEAGEVPQPIAKRAERRKKPPSERFMTRMATRVRRSLADIDYLERQPLGVADGLVVVWAGMRGAVTVAAAQLLPEETPHRPLLVFIAFGVATLSLAIQGGTIGLVVGQLFKGRRTSEAEASAADRQRIRDILRQTADVTARQDGQSELKYRTSVIVAQRSALLDARDDGAVDADALTAALRNLDAMQLTIEMRGEPDAKAGAA